MSADVIHWRRRRTARWLSLSLAARGAVEGIVAAMNDRGELQLPREGLPTLAAVLGRPWTEVEPAIREVFASGKLIYDEERLLVTDPSRCERTAEDRQELAERREDVRVDGVAYRPLSTSPAAVRARAWRAAKKARTLAAIADLEAKQPELPFHMENSPALVRDSVRANGSRTFANATPVVSPPESGVIPSSSPPRSPATEGVRATSPSLSSISSSSKKIREAIPLDPRELPGGWAARAAELRPDLPSTQIARSWERFATEKSLEYKKWPVVQSRWESWLGRERLDAGLPPSPKPPSGPSPSAPSPVAPYYAPARLARPDFEPEAVTAPTKPKPRLVHDEATMSAVARFAAALALPPPVQRSISA